MEIYTPKSLKSENCSKNVYKSDCKHKANEVKMRFEMKPNLKEKKTETQNFMIKFKEIIINRLKTFFEFEDTYYSDGN